MKKLLLTFSCFLLAFISAFAQWSQINSGITGEIESVYMKDLNNIYVAGDLGLYASSDGGNTWTNILVADISALSFVNTMVGYAAGDDGIMYKTTDGGANWNLLNTPTTSQLRALHFYDQNIGAAVGESGALIVTTDGGNTWTSPSSGTSVRLLTVFFSSATTGYLGGRDGVVRQTTDGGVTWSPITVGGGDDISSIYFIDATTGFMAEENNLMKTTDGGNTWNTIPIAGTHELNEIYFLDSNEGYAVGDLGMILKTLDGGNTWIPENSPSPDELSGVHFYNPDNGFAVGDFGTVLKFSTTTSVKELNAFSFEIYPNPSNDYIIIKSDKNGPVDVEITDILGKRMSVINTEFNQRISHGLKDAGIYIVKITAKDAKPVYKRLKVY